MRGGWFVPMKYGAGAVPAGWQGWAVLAGFVLCLVGGAWAVFALGAGAGVSAGWLPAAYMAFAAMAAAGLLFFIRRKTANPDQRSDGKN